MPPVEFGIYLDMLGIVVLAEPSEPFSEVPSQEDSEAFGVEFIRELPESEGAESEAGDDPCTYLGFTMPMRATSFESSNVHQ